jgi:hypothetical protein
MGDRMLTIMYLMILASHRVDLTPIFFGGLLLTLSLDMISILHAVNYIFGEINRLQSF